MKLLADAAVAYRIVLTKADLIKQTQLAQLLQDVRSALKHKIGAHPEPIAVSAKEQAGMAELRAELATLALSI